MVFYVINKESFLMRFENLRKKEKGQYSWFIKDMIANYILDYQGVRFIFRHLIVDDEPILKMKRDATHKIFDILVLEDIFPKIIIPEPILNEEFISSVDEEVGG